jgi:hypothetical protein
MGAESNRLTEAGMEEIGGEDDARDARLGLVSPNEEGRQVLGTCSPERLLARLDQIRADAITAPEKRQVDLCIGAVLDLLAIPTAIACKPPEDR